MASYGIEGPQLPCSYRGYIEGGNGIYLKAFEMIK
jgi:hypothetical protein